MNNEEFFSSELKLTEVHHDITNLKIIVCIILLIALIFGMATMYKRNVISKDNVTENDDGKNIVKKTKIIFAFTPRCGWSQKMFSVWEHAKTHFSEKFDMVDMDCSLNPDECSSYQITGYPTILIEKEDLIVDKLAGYRSYKDLETELDKFASS